MSLTEDRIELQKIRIIDLINKISLKMILNDVTLKIDVLDVYVIADKQLLELVIRNLIQNSKNANPKDNKIIIKGEVTQDKKYKISVIDTGKGIPEEHINRVTEDFYMVDKSRSRENGGSGMGLSICKKILNIHNSELEIISKENVGTTVSFQLEYIKIGKD